MVVGSFVSALNAMHVGVLCGEHFCTAYFPRGIINCNIPLAFKTVAN